MPSSTTSRIAAWGSVPLALVVSSGLVWHASTSAFTDSTDDPAGTGTAGIGLSWEARNA